MSYRLPYLSLLLVSAMLLSACAPQRTRPPTIRQQIRQLQHQAIQYNREGLRLAKQRRYRLAQERFTLAMHRLTMMRSLCFKVPGFCDYRTLNHNYASALTNRGAAKAARGLFDDALLDARKALIYNRGYAKAHFLKGLLHLRLGDFRAARHEARILDRLGYHNRARKLRRKIHRRRPPAY